jgi:hypothetical protein
MRISILQPNGSIRNYILESESELDSIIDYDRAFSIIEQLISSASSAIELIPEDELESFLRASNQMKMN